MLSTSSSVNLIFCILFQPLPNNPVVSHQGTWEQDLAQISSQALENLFYPQLNLTAAAFWATE